MATQANIKTNINSYIADSNHSDWIEGLLEAVKLEERFDWLATKIILEYKGEKTGLAAWNYRKANFTNSAGVKATIPIFEHILIMPKWQYTRVGVRLMLLMEETLRKMEYKQYISEINSNNWKMKKYAVKWGMKPYSENGDGVLYYKNL